MVYLDELNSSEQRRLSVPYAGIAGHGIPSVLADYPPLRFAPFGTPRSASDSSHSHCRASPFASAAAQTCESRPIKVKMGRYIEMTIPPMTTPRKTIMTGSSMVSRLATAASASSS